MNELDAAEAMSTCPGCGLVALVNHGPCDPYGGSSPACWATFNAVTAKDYGEYQYPEVHRLIVDAYMSQHATFATPAGRRSVIVHLVGLYLVLERGIKGQPSGGRSGRSSPTSATCLRSLPNLCLGP